MQDISILLPEEISNMSLPSPELVTYYRNFENRVLWLDSGVDDYFLEYERNIIQWNREDKGKSIEERVPIKLMILSYGGSLDINNSLVNLISISTTPIYGYNMGVCASAGCFIFLSCHKRYTMPNSTFLIHKGSAENISGTFDQIVAYIEDYSRQMNELIQYIKARTTIDDETLEENIGTEWYISANDALKFGICDEIVSNIDQLL